MSNEKFWVLCWSILAVTIIFVTLITTIGRCYSLQTFLKNGYEQKWDSDDGYLLWQKVDTVTID